MLFSAICASWLVAADKIGFVFDHQLLLAPKLIQVKAVTNNFEHDHGISDLDFLTVRTFVINELSYPALHCSLTFSCI